jgi:hypothetical protein
MPSESDSHSVRVAPQAQVVANEVPYLGMDLNTNFLEYDGQLVDEDPAGRYPPPDSQCLTGHKGRSTGQVRVFAR